MLLDAMEKFGRKDLECLVVNIVPQISPLCVATVLDVNLSKYAKHVEINFARLDEILYLHEFETAH